LLSQGIASGRPQRPCLRGKEYVLKVAHALVHRPHPSPTGKVSALTPVARPRETDAERRDRELDMLREMAELGMQMARAAAARALDPDSQTAPDFARDPTLAFARATCAVRQAIALETRIAAAELAPARAQPAPASAHDPRRPALRQALYKLADAEPERAARAQLRRHIDERIEHELLADPGADLPPGDVFAAICDDLGLHLDPSALPDELLGLPPAPRKPDGNAPLTQSPAPSPSRPNGPAPQGPWSTAPPAPSG
jgi:hypothetical protein